MSTTEQNKDIIRRAVAALGRGDLDGFLADTTDDFHITVMGTPPGGSTLSGKQSVIKILKKVFGAKIVNSAIPMTIDNFITEGEFVVEQAHGRAKTLDGRDYNNSYCRVWRVVDGKIRSLNEYMDTELARACLWT